MSRTATIIGGGVMGATCAQVLADNGHEVLIYERSADKVAQINRGFHPVFLTPLKNVRAQSWDNQKITDKFVIIAVPSKIIRQILADLEPFLEGRKIFVNVSKGIENESLLRFSEIAAKMIGPTKLEAFVTLTGPCHAEELNERRLSTMIAAHPDLRCAQAVQRMFSNGYLRIYTSTDQIGAEFSGMTKNAIAVISGIAKASDLGENASAALLSRGLVEMVRIVTCLGGSNETVFGLAGIGDLLVTANNNLSRNYRAGLKVGRGQKLDRILAEESQTIEGFRSIEALYQLSLERKIDLPLIHAAYKVIFEGAAIDAVIKKLFARELKHEKIG
jgi:glycerol-3-phosphate dehydrogenase (NAD(P)+)